MNKLLQWPPRLPKTGKPHLDDRYPPCLATEWRPAIDKSSTSDARNSPSAQSDAHAHVPPGSNTTTKTSSPSQCTSQHTMAPLIRNDSLSISLEAVPGGSKISAKTPFGTGGAAGAPEDRHHTSPAPCAR